MEKITFTLADDQIVEFYVLEQTVPKASSLYIAQIKKKCGLDVGENFNLAKMQAFRHFGIL